MGSNKGFVRKYSSDGGEIWTKADFLDQISEVVYDPREDVLVLTLSTENIMKITNEGQVVKTINLKVIRINTLKIIILRSFTGPGDCSGRRGILCLPLHGRSTQDWIHEQGTRACQKLRYSLAKLERVRKHSLINFQLIASSKLHQHFLV